MLTNHFWQQIQSAICSLKISSARGSELNLCFSLRFNSIFEEWAYSDMADGLYKRCKCLLAMSPAGIFALLPRFNST